MCAYKCNTYGEHIDIYTFRYTHFVFSVACYEGYVCIQVETLEEIVIVSVCVSGILAVPATGGAMSREMLRDACDKLPNTMPLWRVDESVKMSAVLKRSDPSTCHRVNP